jgi:MtaA/CmuA family methyltransferase
MTGKERCLKTIAQQVPDRVPVIPQDMTVAALLAGYDQIEIARDAKKRATAILQQRERFGFDGVVFCGDTVCLAESVGVEVHYSTDECPRWKAGFLDDEYNGLDSLKLPDPTKDGRLPVWVETTRLVQEKIGDEYLVMARADQGAFSLASMMRGMQDFLMDIALAADDPELDEKILRLLSFCNDAQFEFIKALVEAGAHVVTTGDSISGPSVCSPEIYRKYSLPFEADMVRRCNALGVPYSIHICGFTEPIIPYWLEAGAPIWEIDHKTDFTVARAQTRGKTTLFGNLDCTGVMCFGKPELVLEKSREVIEQAKPDPGFILSSGCMLAAITPPDNLAAMVEAAHKYGQY